MGGNTTHDNEAAIGALVRYTFGIDAADSHQLESAFSSDAVLDLTKFSKLGMNFPAVRSREAIVQTCMNTVGNPLDTTHSLSNFQVGPGEHDNELKVTCYAEAQHFKKDQGLAQGVKEHFLSKSRYDAILSRQEGTWKITHLGIEPLWSLGNPDVLSG